MKSQLFYFIRLNKSSSNFVTEKQLKQFHNFSGDALEDQ